MNQQMLTENPFDHRLRLWLGEPMSGKLVKRNNKAK